MEFKKEFPLDIRISFHKIIELYREQLERESNGIFRSYLGEMLEYVSGFSALSQGMENTGDLLKYDDPIRMLLKDLFPKTLSDTEVKAVSIPFHNLIFHPTQRFMGILEDAGEDFELSMRNLDEDHEYIFACILILNTYYGYNLDFSRPLYYDIPNKDGITRHYRVDQNSAFFDIEPTDKSLDISDKDVDALIQNIEDVSLWKKFFPPKSWVFNGFTIINLTDVTIDDAISKLKSTLLYRNISYREELEKFEEIFRSIYRIPDLRVGFTVYNEEESAFEHMENSTSYILDLENENDCKAATCEFSYSAIVKEQKNFIVSNVDTYKKEASHSALYKNFKKNKVNSAILAPIAKRGRLLGVLELVSHRKNELNSINATKLDDILPYIVTAVERNKSDYENRVKAIIQNECTSIHPSVLWVFEKEARRYIRDLDQDGLASFKDIVFEDIYPLYGQIDIVASSEARNNAIQEDLLTQLSTLKDIIKEAQKAEPLEIYEQIGFRIDEFIEELHQNLDASSEQKVFNLLQREINPVIEHLEKVTPNLKKMLQDYREMVSSETGILYNRRKDYDESVQQVNRTMARYLDKQQVMAQNIFPHYFERYKTDGVDHNIYIGQALSNHKEKPFDEIYLYDLRLWQLRTMCEMENRFYALQEEMPLSLEAASLILVYSSTLSIRYRMDEKRFDVDGTYNARYEIIKKRIDKACIKGTEQRVAQKGKIAIIYSHRKDEREYLRYIKYLQAKKYLGSKVELVELEDVQGVIGLKAIRVDVLYTLSEDANEQAITYEDLGEVLK